MEDFGFIPGKDLVVNYKSMSSNLSVMVSLQATPVADAFSLTP